jgi:hypothetical protein
MRAGLAFVAALLFPPGSAVARGEGISYACKIERTNPLGKLKVEWRMTPSGEGTPTYAYWTTENGASATLSMSWMFRGTAGPPPDDAFVSVTHWYTRGRRRVELRRDAASQPLVGAYDRRRWQVSINRSLAEMRIFAGDAQVLDVRAVDRNGRVLGTGQVNPATLRAAAALSADIQQEIDAVLADFRNRCELHDPANEVVVAP